MTVAPHEVTPWWRDAERTDAIVNAWVRKHVGGFLRETWREWIGAAGFAAFWLMAYAAFPFYLWHGPLALAGFVAISWYLGYKAAAQFYGPGRDGTNDDETPLGRLEGGDV